ncbi:MAG: transcriptional regulator with XRE-family HTH domain [Planctomycetota bacterium]|jgi:transcriptional regulator with XRE-family HTH domain
MKIDPLTPDDAILTEFARRLRQVRKQNGYSQEQLAKNAGIGVATLRRIEDGQDAQIVSWLKILRALSMVNAIDELLPESYVSPRAEALAKKKKGRHKRSSTPGIKWGDELP